MSASSPQKNLLDNQQGKQQQQQQRSSFDERSPLTSPDMYSAQFPAATSSPPEADDSPTSKLECKPWMDKQLQWIIQGLGMAANFYVIGALGNIKPVLRITEPECWNVTISTECTSEQRVATSGVVFAGLIIGMLAGGTISDAYGRRMCSMLSAGGMLFFNILLAALVVPGDPSTNITLMTISLGGFGLFLGAEYPSSAAASAEKAEDEREEFARLGKNPPLDRGQKVVLPFLMQGVGGIVNCLVIISLLAAFGQTAGGHYDDTSLTVVWRLQYALCCPVLCYLLYYRYRYVHDTAKFKELRSRAAGNRGVFFRYYWHRLIGTASCWMCWDVAFYGVRVSMGVFIVLIAKSHDPFEILMESLLINVVSMGGYVLAAKYTDTMGRWWMQVMGFSMLAISFLPLGIWYDDLTNGSESGRLMLRLLLYVSFFFGQLGPNATTFVFPAEIFPLHVRSLGHGFSGAWGPGVGGAVGAAVMAAVSPATSFYIGAVVALAGVILTIVFLPDVSKMHLDANDEFWHSIMARNAGHAANFAYLDYSRPENLSLFERLYWFNATFGDSLQLASPAMGRSEMATDSSAGTTPASATGMGRPKMSDLSLTPPVRGLLNPSSSSDSSPATLESGYRRGAPQHEK